jgi:DDE superfamily endonuclease
MLNIFSSNPFYADYVHLPGINDPISKYITDNEKFYPFFAGAIGALDGTHFDCSGTPEQRAIARDRKGHVTQNCLAACDFSHRFVYVFSGWEGSIMDSTMFNDARITDLRVPTASNRYYLADAGFPNSLSLMLPYRGVRYHLMEWSRAELRYCIVLTLYIIRVF